MLHSVRWNGVARRRAIWADCTSSVGAEGFLLQDLGSWPRSQGAFCSSALAMPTGEFSGSRFDSLTTLDNTVLNPHLLAGNQSSFQILMKDLV